MSYNESNYSIVSNEYIKDFLLGGKCECGIENIQTKNKYMYKIIRNKSNPNMYFIYSKTGLGDIYAGFLIVNNEEISYTKGAKGQIDADDVRIKSILYVLKHALTLPQNVLVYHFGKCSRCGRQLTDLDSIRRGLGPECSKKV